MTGDVIYIKLSNWWGRGDLQWPALSGLWLSRTGCWQIFYMKLLMYGLLFYIYLPTQDVSVHEPSFRITDWKVAIGLIYTTFTLNTKIINRSVPCLATDSPCGVWGRMVTICGSWFLNNSWWASLAKRREIFYWFMSLFMCLYITQVMHIFFP